MPRSRRGAARGILLLALVTAGACYPFRRGEEERRVITLFVQNLSSFDVVVYALPSGTPESRVRIGRVGAQSGDTLEVNEAWAPGGVLTLRLHAFGTQRYWTTPGVSVWPGVAACLDVYSDPYGDLSRSSFYTRLVATRGNEGARVENGNPAPSQAIGCAAAAAGPAVADRRLPGAAVR